MNDPSINILCTTWKVGLKNVEGKKKKQNHLVSHLSQPHLLLQHKIADLNHKTKHSCCQQESRPYVSDSGICADGWMGKLGERRIPQQAGICTIRIRKRQTYSELMLHTYSIALPFQFFSEQNLGGINSSDVIIRCGNLITSSCTGEKRDGQCA